MVVLRTHREPEARSGKPERHYGSVTWKARVGPGNLGQIHSRNLRQVGHPPGPACRLFLFGATMPAMRILIIEDDRQAASYLVKAFREAGHVADDAADGLDGYAMAREGAYTRRRPNAAEARRPFAARAGRRHAGPDSLRPRPGRRPGKGPAGWRGRLSPQTLCLLRAPCPRRGAGAPPRPVGRERADGLSRRGSRARPAVASGHAQWRRDRTSAARVPPARVPDEERRPSADPHHAARACLGLPLRPADQRY